MNIQANLDPVSFIILFGILQGTLIIYYFLQSPASRKINRNYILVFAVMVLLSAEAFLNISGYMVHTLFLLNLGTPLILLVGPLLLLQGIRLSGKNISSLSWIHFLPALLFFGYSFFFYLQPAAYKYNALAHSFHPYADIIPLHQRFESDPLHIRGIVVVELISLHLMVYGITGLIRFRKLADRNLLLLMNLFILAAGICILLSEGFIINGVRFLPNPLPSYTPAISSSVGLYCFSFYLLGRSYVARIKPEKYSKSKNTPRDAKQECRCDTPRHAGA